LGPESLKCESVRGRKMQGGFSLIEVMIALTVLALVALGLGQAFLQGQRHARTIEQDRAVNSTCQSMLMDLAGRNWGNTTTPGTIEYMRVNSPIAFQLSEFPGETGTITVNDVSTSFSEKVKTGSVYKIEVSFRQHVFIAYVDNVN
jgi:prepilin-type N-terminal cleavage/methylation domain-containing protein